jgi:hypothetical protein
MRAILAVLSLLVSAWANELVNVDEVQPQSQSQPNAGCSWTSPDGAYFDLSRLRLTAEDYMGDDQYLKYRMNICGGVVSDSKCFPSAICSFWKDDGTYHQQYGDWQGNPSPQWELITPGAPREGVKITFTNGKSSCMGKIETAYMNLRCDPTAPSVKTFIVQEDFGKCTLTITYTNAISCPGGGGGGDGTSSGGISGGTVFLIILAVVIPIYIAGGCYWNRSKKGMSGTEACPHYEFWHGIWDNAKAGCLFTKNKITGGGGNSSGYVKA